MSARSPLSGGLIALVLAATGLVWAAAPTVRAADDVQTYGEAMSWYLDAAEAGDARAQYLLGYALETGARGEADPPAARTWYETAAGQGNLRAAYRLALMLIEGRGGAADEARARDLLADPARAGDTDAQSLLGYLLAHEPDGDAKAAYRWLTLATEGGDGAAARNLAVLRGTLSPEMLTAAEDALAEWRSGD